MTPKVKDAVIQCDDLCSALSPATKDASTQCSMVPPLMMTSSPLISLSESELSDNGSQHEMDTSQCTFSPGSSSS